MLPRVPRRTTVARMDAYEPPDLTDVVVLRSELLGQGYTDPQIRALVRSGEVHRVRHGSYVAGELWARLSATDRHRVMVRAVLRRAHPATVATHVSAVVERGGPTWGVSLEHVHTTRTDGRCGRREAGIVHHRGKMPAEQVEMVNGVPVSSAARAAVEMTTITTIESALVSVNGMLHASDLDFEDLASMVHDLRHWPETLNAGLVLRLCDARIESAGESRAFYLCWAQRLPCPEPQVKVFDEYGQLFARVDLGWPELGVFLEFDGTIKYLLFRRENETLEQYLLREKRREERICLLTGWICVRITWADLENPVATARRIRRILDSRSEKLGA